MGVVEGTDSAFEQESATESEAHLEIARTYCVALVGEGEVEDMSYCQTQDEMVDAVPEAGQQHSWAEKGEVGDGVEPVPVAEFVTEIGVEKGDGAAVEDGPGYVAEFGAADTEALAPVENEAVTEMELGNMAVSAHELLGKSALSGGVAAVGWLVRDFAFEPQQEPGHLEAEFGVEFELEKFGAVA